MIGQPMTRHDGVDLIARRIQHGDYVVAVCADSVNVLPGKLAKLESWEGFLDAGSNLFRTDQIGVLAVAAMAVEHTVIVTIPKATARAEIAQALDIPSLANNDKNIVVIKDEVNADDGMMPTALMDAFDLAMLAEDAT